ncbi:hypothetical protein LSAT2_006540 [Lamellibrachia satsuma]|nr:hypothetical protein LSAT2_006540 [Lamellibrachia satsuma]
MVLNKSREVTHVMPPDSMEGDDRDNDLCTVEPRRAVDITTDSPAIVRSPLAAEPGTPTTRRGLRFYKGTSERGVRTRQGYSVERARGSLRRPPPLPLRRSSEVTVS